MTTTTSTCLPAEKTQWFAKPPTKHIKKIQRQSQDGWLLMRSKLATKFFRRYPKAGQDWRERRGRRLKLKEGRLRLIRLSVRRLWLPLAVEASLANCGWLKEIWTLLIVENSPAERGQLRWLRHLFSIKHSINGWEWLWWLRATLVTKRISDNWKKLRWLRVALIDRNCSDEWDKLYV